MSNASAPLEEVVTHGDQSKLLPPSPPSYAQAVAGPPAPSAPNTHIVVVNQPEQQYGPGPQDIQCPYCHNYARTRIRFRPSSRTHLMALLLCLLQLYCCICLPYCIASCMEAQHFCGMCDRYLGTYSR